MYSDVTFSMDGRSSAQHRVGSFLIPQAAQFFPRWVDRGDRAYVTLMVRDTVVEDMIAMVCRMHPSVRFIATEAVNPSDQTGS